MVPASVKGLEHPGVLDAMAYDTRSGTLVLAMYESRPWSGGEAQLFQLQEKLNAYLSFALDGELQEAYPDLAGRKISIQLRTLHEPDETVAAFASSVRGQLAFQDIEFEIVQVEPGQDEH